MIKLYSITCTYNKRCYYGIYGSFDKDNNFREFKLAGSLNNLTKNAAAIGSLIQTLKCVKEEHRNIDTVIYCAQYPMQCIDRANNTWLTNPNVNIDLIEYARNLVLQFDNLTVKKFQTYAKGYIEAKKAATEYYSSI